MKVKGKTKGDCLVSDRNALVRLVNLHDEEMYGNEIPVLPPGLVDLFSFVKEENPQARAQIINTLLWKVRELLRRAWKTKEARERDWYLFELRREMHRYQMEYIPTVPPIGNHGPETITAFRNAEIHRRMSEPPARSRLEDVLYVLQVNGSWLRICKREDQCQEPTHYFISENSEYCSDSCKQAARAEAKRKWWSDHGDTEEMKRQQHRAYLARKAAKSKVKGRKS